MQMEELHNRRFLAPKGTGLVEASLTGDGSSYIETTLTIQDDSGHQVIFYLGSYTVEERVETLGILATLKQAIEDLADTIVANEETFQKIYVKGEADRAARKAKREAGG